MIALIVAFFLYLICDAIERHCKKKQEDVEYACNLFKEGLRDMGIDLDEGKSKPKYRMKEVPAEDVIFFSNTSDGDEAFKL